MDDGNGAVTGYESYRSRPGRVRPMILLWALGVPLPIILIILLIRGCAY
jgi:hypothetical protein